MHGSASCRLRGYKSRFDRFITFKLFNTLLNMFWSIAFHGNCATLQYCKEHLRSRFFVIRFSRSGSENSFPRRNPQPLRFLSRSANDGLFSGFLSATRAGFPSCCFYRCDGYSDRILLFGSGAFPVKGKVFDLAVTGDNAGLLECGKAGFDHGLRICPWIEYHEKPDTHRSGILR